MGVPKVIMMRNNPNGTKEQIYPVTEVNAVEGLKELISKSGDAKIGVSSINGQTGDVVLPVLSERDYVKIMAIIEAFENSENEESRGI